MTAGSVAITVSEHQALIRIDRDPVNAMDAAMWQELHSTALSLQSATEITSVVITGGPSRFSAGGDLKEISTMSASQVEGHRGALQQSAVSAIAAIPQPVIAAIEGYAVGGGFEICLAADFRVCGSNAFIGLPEVTLGMLPAAGGTQRLIRLIGLQGARRMLYTGAHLSASDALHMGAVDEVVEDGTALDRARAWALDLSEHYPAISRLKQALLEGPQMTLPQALQLESRLWALSLADPHTQHLLSRRSESVDSAHAPSAQRLGDTDD
jgi:enoyl-CoA hydratase/carnithine racemase